MGYGLGELGYAILLAAIVWFCLVFYFSIRHWGRLRIYGIVHDYKRIARKQIGYGSKIYFSGIVTFFIEPLTKILISNFVGINEVGYFDIALKVKAQFQGLITRLLDPFYPYISQLLDPKKLRRIVNDVEQKFLFLSIPLIAMLIFVLEPLLDLWLGTNNNREITISAIVITCVHLITMSVLPMYYYLVSKNYVKKTIILNVVTVVVNSVIFFLLYKNYGIFSAVISLCGSVIVTFILTIYYQKKYLDCYIFSSEKKISKF